MDKLIVKNFGPIKDISIDVNDINIFIGPTSSGKSTVAKLIAIFKNPEFIVKGYQKFTELLVEYNIDFEWRDDTQIEYRIGEFYWRLSSKGYVDYNPFKTDIQDMYIIDRHEKNNDILNDSISRVILLRFMKDLPNQFLTEITDNGLNEKVDFQEYKKYVRDLYKEAIEKIGIEYPVYIPAERTLLPSIGESLFGLMKNDVSIAESLKGFGSMFEIARKNLKSYGISFLQTKYEYSEKNNYLTFSDGVKVKLENASSGFQSLVPLMLVMEYFSQSKRLIDNCFVVEEPELNLYPSMQKSLVEFILSKVSQSSDRLIITTHSPYTLTTIDNLIQAKNAFEKHPELKDEINNTVPESLWIDFNRVSCYYFDDGHCRSTLDGENQSIGPSNIDNVSEELGKTFDELLELKYKD